MSEVRHPIGTPVLLKERGSADLSDGHIVQSIGVKVTDIGFVGEVHKAGFDNGYDDSGRSLSYDVVFPNKGIIERLSAYQFEVTEFEGPDIPEMKEAREVRIGDVLKSDKGVKFVVSELGVEDDYGRVGPDTTLYFTGRHVGDILIGVRRDLELNEKVEVYEK